MENDLRRIRVLFSLAGASSAALISVLCLASTNGQTDVELSLCLASFGVAAGLTIGHALSRWSGASPAGTRRVLAAGVLLLTGTLGAVAGWLAGDFRVRNRQEEWTQQRVPAAAGAGVGLVIGAAVLALKRREPDPPTGPPL